MKLFTIGFTKHSAESFFTKLKAAKVKRIIDTRLNNSSQLSGFAKKDDLKFFLKTISGIDYAHLQELAPSAEILNEYKSASHDWKAYEKKFLQLMKKRKIEELFGPEDFQDACLLCSEHLPHHCHRRLVAEYLQKKWGNITIVHL